MQAHAKKPARAASQSSRRHVRSSQGLCPSQRRGTRSPGHARDGVCTSARSRQTDTSLRSTPEGRRASMTSPLTSSIGHAAADRPCHTAADQHNLHAVSAPINIMLCAVPTFVADMYQPHENNNSPNFVLQQVIPHRAYKQVIPTRACTTARVLGMPKTSYLRGHPGLGHPSSSELCPSCGDWQRLLCACLCAHGCRALWRALAPCPCDSQTSALWTPQSVTMWVLKKPSGRTA